MAVHLVIGHDHFAGQQRCRRLLVAGTGQFDHALAGGQIALGARLEAFEGRSFVRQADHGFVTCHAVPKLFDFPGDSRIRCGKRLRRRAENVTRLEGAQIGDRDVQTVGDVDHGHGALCQSLDIGKHAVHRDQCKGALQNEQKQQKRQSPNERVLDRECGF